MRVVLLFLGIIFILFAIVQFNDPDPFLWILIYLIPATASFYLLKWRINPFLLLALCLIYLTGAIYLFPPSVSEWISVEEEAKSLGMMMPGIEEGREAMGLFLCSLSFLLFFYYQRKKTA
ncbi:MAG: transmembrane 220 family protein [Cyclobacteriaceae bacterium]|nr:transmembrane 220 family protein [Cyclobacteriaceae bacterium]